MSDKSVKKQSVNQLFSKLAFDWFDWLVQFKKGPFQHENTTVTFTFKAGKRMNENGQKNDRFTFICTFSSFGHMILELEKTIEMPGYKKNKLTQKLHIT